jgi:flagellar hook-associated protein 1 FlgK
MAGSGGLSIGLSALIAHRQALDVIGQNLANVNTEGYTRQRVNLRPDTGPITPAVFSIYDGTGTGVRVQNIERLRERFLEIRAHQEHAAHSQLDGLEETMAQVEKTFGEPSDSGISALLADFFGSWADLSNAPTELATRSQVAQRGETLAAAVRLHDGNLAELRSSLQEQLVTRIDQVNVMTKQFGALNDRIRGAQADGDAANELRDQRDLLALKLAQEVGARFLSNEDGTIDAFIGTQVLIRSERAEVLSVAVDASPAANISLAFASGGNVTTAGGRAAASIQGVNDVVPRYRTELTAMANTLANEVNAVHTAAYDKSGAAGVAFFTFGTNGIQVNPVVLNDPSKVAASSVPGGGNDGSAARAVSVLDGAEASYRDVVVKVAVEAQAATRRLEVQKGVVTQLDNSREAYAGVNMDEELANLIATQRAYEAAARFISVLNETMDTLVNSLVR